MNSFLKKIGCFSVLIVLGAVLIEIGFSLTNFSEYHWGNPFYAEKIADLKGHENLNVFFLGSSQFYRHINPIEFDQITNSKSYNLGVQGLATPENYYLFEKMLSKENIPSNSTVFLALSGIQSIAPSNFYSKRSTYFLNWGIVNSSVRIILDESRPLRTKIFRLYSFLANYSYKFLGLPRLRSWLSGFQYQGGNEFTKKKGFLALDDDLQDEFIDRNIDFQKKKKPLKKRLENTFKDFQNQKSVSNKAHIQKIRSLLEPVSYTHLTLPTICSV